MVTEKKLTEINTRTRTASMRLACVTQMRLTKTTSLSSAGVDHAIIAFWNHCYGVPAPIVILKPSSLKIVPAAFSFVLRFNRVVVTFVVRQLDVDELASVVDISGVHTHFLTNASTNFDERAFLKFRFGRAAEKAFLMGATKMTSYA